MGRRPKKRYLKIIHSLVEDERNCIVGTNEYTLSECFLFYFIFLQKLLLCVRGWGWGWGRLDRKLSGPSCSKAT